MQYIKLVALIILIILIAIFLYYENNAIQITYYNIKNRDIPEDFINYKIVQLSDLHNKSFGENQEKLVKLVKKINPNIIVITGDIIDRRRYNETPSLILVSQLTQIAPVYYVTGNHEEWSGKFNDLEKKLAKYKVNVLKNQRVEVKQGNSKVNIIGVNDYAYFQSVIEYKQVLEDLTSKINKSDFTLLLSHRPEKIKYYSEYHIDLALTGHAHGGQIRLPFIGGLVAPDQGLIPKYTGGFYEKGNLQMIVNRGLGNSLFPQRLFNRPEVVVITLKRE
ncbi:metallophosphoesterase [Caldisalinibacter kiritimatiensis]|uniref:Calcineurin-like phosphoesterase domain-containing protein n=1 Tax=Caldisalinibacter kiritimatiensis TaxID=1304284 RepID=R1ASN5_9FIRM|nr:metallophosphoesterase [Caldisalinibacter kiritimatiensis]EOC99681.1 hypothetical protein L21TH_2324 [Caldisalinibacter kiritimatiensis]